MQNFIYHMPVKVYFEEGGVKKYLSKEMEKESRKYTADRIGIACPLYEFNLPSLAKDFILTSEFLSYQDHQNSGIRING